MSTRSGWRLTAWFFGLLLTLIALDYLWWWGWSSFLISSMNRHDQMAWFSRYGGLAAYWLLCFAVFMVAGATLASKLRSRFSAITFGFLLGFSFTVITWLDGPRTVYSHAPLWLWALAWGSLYVPAVAGVSGALLRHHFLSRRETT